MTYVIYLKRKIFFIFLISLLTSSAFCQVDSASQCTLELIKLEARYRSAGNLSFNVKFFSTEKDSTGVYVTDSIFGTYKISGYNLWSKVDSVEQIQNDKYVVIDYPNDSTLFITKPDINYKTVFPNNFVDSIFLQYEVNGMSISNYSGVQKRLAMFFNVESPYLSYDLYYDSTTYLINKLEYRIKQNNDYLKISLLISNYQTTAIDKIIFSTAKYFTERDHKYIIAQAYYNYEIINPPNEIGYEVQH